MSLGIDLADQTSLVAEALASALPITLRLELRCIRGRITCIPATVGDTVTGQKQHLYVIGEGDGCAVVKIGKSLDPAKRLSELQTGYPRKLRVLYVELEAGSIERWLHERFADYRQEGEWFQFAEDTDPVAQVREAVREWQKEYEHCHAGEPTYFAYVHLGCRHRDCRAAAAEYRARLKDRQRSGDFKDRRFKENWEQQPADLVLQQFVADPETASKLRDLLGIPQALPAPESAEDEAVVASESQTAVPDPLLSSPRFLGPLQTILGLLTSTRLAMMLARSTSTCRSASSSVRRTSSTPSCSA